MDNKKFVVAVVGPTATGKTKLAVALAKATCAEVICADSMQIYKGMNIGTAKPTVREMQGIKHHLVDFLSPNEEYSVAKYVKMARECIKEICARNKTPIICGGTGLYIRNLLIDNLFLPMSVNRQLRGELQERSRMYGTQPLFEELLKIDPQTAAKLHVNDEKRIIRALEFYYSNGKTLSQQNCLSQNKPIIYNKCVIGLDYKDRNKLYQNINSRIDEMMAAGLLGEAQKVLNSPCGATAAAAIAYKEFIPYFNEDISLEQAIETLKRSTRRYAKRQLTWFRKDDSVFWIYIDEFESFSKILDIAKNTIEKKKTT